MDSSAAGKAHGAPNMDAWGRIAPGAGASHVATPQAVRPSRDPRRLRDRDKDKDGADSSDDGQPEHVEQEPHGGVPAAALALQAVDPESGRVLWQTASAGENPPASVTTEDPYALGYEMPESGETATAGQTGLLGKRAYGTGEAAETPRVVKTA